jgi:hypothetical protein
MQSVQKWSVYLIYLWKCRGFFKLVEFIKKNVWHKVVAYKIITSISIAQPSTYQTDKKFIPLGKVSHFSGAERERWRSWFDHPQIKNNIKKSSPGFSRKFLHLGKYNSDLLAILFLGVDGSKERRGCGLLCKIIPLVMTSSLFKSQTQCYFKQSE